MYTDEFLISELHRFVRENGRSPKQLDMDAAGNGYPSVQAYESHFGSWNNALETAGLKINGKHRTLDGTETCSYCGKYAEQIPGFIQWFYNENDNNKRHCNKCGNPNGIFDYKKGNLDINSSTGLGRAGEICVIKTLGIGKEFDCNRESCHYPIDMYHDEYGKIDVKTALLSNNSNNWLFNFIDKPEIKTFICLGLSSNRSDVEHVWVVPNNNNKRSFSTSNTFSSLLKNKKWEVDVKPYNNTWKTMKLDSCKIMVDKNKEKIQEEKQKSLQSRKELIERLCLKGYEEINDKMVFKLKKGD